MGLKTALLLYPRSQYNAMRTGRGPRSCQDRNDELVIWPRAIYVFGKREFPPFIPFCLCVELELAIFVIVKFQLTVGMLAVG